MTTEIRNNPAQSRYELFVDGERVGIADYYPDGDTLVFPHTEILAHRRGEGWGAALVRGALDDVRAAGKRVAPHCWYVAAFIDGHAEYRDLLATTSAAVGE